MGVILTLMLIVGDYNLNYPIRSSVAISHQRFNTLAACTAAGELAKMHASQLTPNAHVAHGGSKIVYFCAAEGH